MTWIVLQYGKLGSISQALHLNIHPNRQNVRYWSVNDPEIEVECKQMGGPKIMCWAGLIDGKIMLHWFNVNENVNQTVYLDMLQNFLWPKVRNVSSRKAYWFQQDLATAHTAPCERSSKASSTKGSSVVLLLFLHGQQRVLI